MDFAVWHEGIPEGQGKWVIALDMERERVLLAEGKDLYWKPLGECQFLKVASPDNPRLVVQVPQPPRIVPGNGSAIDMLNRAARRGLRN